MTEGLNEFEAFDHSKAQELAKVGGYNPFLVGIATDEINSYIENNICPERTEFALKDVIGQDSHQSTINAVVEIYREAGYTVRTDNGTIIIKV
jgi:hypothetical protein